MTNDIYKYRSELEEKLAAVNVVIAGMGGRSKGLGAGVVMGVRKRRKMSAAARAKIAAAQRARWARQKSGK